MICLFNDAMHFLALKKLEKHILVVLRDFIL